MAKKDKKDVKNEKECSCGCGCGPDCKCGCQEGGKCTCGDGCGCECGCGCGDMPKWIKPAVTLISALTISWAILTVGNRVNCPCPYGQKMMPAFMMGEKAKRPDGVKKMRRARGMDEAAMRDFIMKNPKVLIDSVDAYYQALQEKEEASMAKAAPQMAPKEIVDAIVNDSTNHVLGNPKGSFVIVEFFDYQCGWCKKTNQEMAKALKDAPNVRWILIDAPIFGPDSEKIAAYAMAAGKQGKFKQMHDAITNAQGRMDEKALIELAQKLKLDTKQLKADANAKAVQEKLAKNKELVQKLNLRGVPMLIVDGKIHPGALFGDDLAAVVEASNAQK